MPALLEPGRKPVGDVVVDTAHPGGAVTRYCLLPQGASDIQNLGYEPKVKAIAGGTSVITPAGLGVLSGAETAHSAVTLTPPFTMHTRHVTLSTLTGGSRIAASIGDAGQNDVIQIVYTPYEINLSVKLNFTSYIATLNPAGNIHRYEGAVVDVVGEFVSHTEKNVYVWVDGVYVGTASNTTDSSGDASALAQIDKCCISPSNSTSATLFANLYDGLIIDKASLASNPYQMLIPA